MQRVAFIRTDGKYLGNQLECFRLSEYLYGIDYYGKVVSVSPYSMTLAPSILVVNHPRYKHTNTA